jgi:dihydroneopterin aldolase
MDPDPDLDETFDTKDKHWPNLKNSWAIKEAAGEPQAKISVRNLQTTIHIGRDAWGREGKLQPALISVTVSLRKPFEYASVQDTVNSSTVHYGILSKTILEAVQEFHDKGGVSTKEGKSSTMKALMDHIAGHLTSYSLDGAPNSNPLVLESHKPLLDRKLVSWLNLKVTLPKALLNSTTGVSRSGAIVFDVRFLDPSFNLNRIVDNHAMSLVLHDLRVSALVGVNSNERLARQLVIANIEIDEWITERDLYNELEELVYKVNPPILPTQTTTNIKLTLLPDNRRILLPNSRISRKSLRLANNPLHY